jgi:hypothetical protein
MRPAGFGRMPLLTELGGMISSHSYKHCAPPERGNTHLYKGQAEQALDENV